MRCREDEAAEVHSGRRRPHPRAYQAVRGEELALDCATSGWADFPADPGPVEELPVPHDQDRALDSRRRHHSVQLCDTIWEEVGPDSENDAWKDRREPEK